jgi:hypothetical protein
MTMTEFSNPTRRRSKNVGLLDLQLMSCEGWRDLIIAPARQRVTSATARRGSPNQHSGVNGVKTPVRRRESEF